MNERWVPIVGYEGIYEVSDLGRVRSLDRRARVRYGATRSVRGRAMVQRVHPWGYRTIILYRGNAPAGFLVHRLVAEAFIGPIRGMEVNHKDGDKCHNDVRNLEIVSRQENIDHAVKHGLINNKGERNSQAKITAEMARAILADHAAGMGYKRLAKKHGLTWSLVRSVASGRTWGHLSGSST